MKHLVVIETHPIQYHAPVYRALQQTHPVRVTAVYGSDFSVAGYHDTEFGTSVQWDTDLLSGYEVRFLTTVAQGGGQSIERAHTRGLDVMLRALKPDAILLVGYSPRFHQTAFWSSWQYGAPLLFRGETTDVARVRSTWKHFARTQLLKNFYARFGALLYVGKNSRAHFASLGVPENKLFFSPYGVDTTPFRLDETSRTALRATVRDTLGIAPTQTVVLFAGKLSQRKAPDLLLQAAKEFPAQVRERVVLLFMGDGELRAQLQTRADESPRIEARFVGFQNQTALSRFYHASDMLALPSQNNETWGLVVNEALHHGVPCIVSDRVGCAPDLIQAGETGYVFRAGAAEDLVHVLQKGFALCGRAEIRAACMARAAEYAIDRAAQGIAQAFLQVTR